MLTLTPINAHINYISKLLTEQNIPNQKYYSQEEVPWIKIQPIYHHLYFYKNHPPYITLHDNQLPNDNKDTYYNYDDLANPQAYQWLTQIIHHIHQTHLLIQQHQAPEHQKIPF